MSELALTFPEGEMVDGDEATRAIKREISRAKEDRKRFEPTWHSDLAFAANKPWLVWDRDQRRLAFPPDLRGKDLYSADVITEYRMTALGELMSGDDRPQVLLRREDEPSEGYEEILNLALGFGWDTEWRGDEVLSELRRMVIDLGTGAIRCRWDPAYGPMLHDNVPYLDNRPLLDLEEATSAMGNGPNPNVQMRSMQRGRVCWDVLSPFNILVPPGVPHERYFPWECVVRPMRLADAKALWGKRVGDLKEDTDIGSILGLDLRAEITETYSALGSPEGGQGGRLKDHVWVYTYYERASPKYPSGRTLTFVGSKMRLVSIEDKLPYQLGDGSYHSGIVYFHWWRVTGRFWSRSLVGNMKDVQRSINKRATQKNEIIDRGLPYVIVERNSRAKQREGKVMELLEVERDEREPRPVPGLTPGDWMYRDIDMLRVDLEHATGLRGPRLGENPTGVTTYAQLALLNENDQVKRGPIREEHQLAINLLVEATIYDIKRYWGEERMIPLAGEEGRIELQSFNGANIPSFYMVEHAKGGSKPRSQGAELQKVQDLWMAAANSGAVQGAPTAWVSWYKDSLEAGQALDLPEPSPDVHLEKAKLENHVMLQGQQVPVQYYDPHALHIPIHREAQIEAEYVGDQGTWQLIEQHISEHMAAEMANQMQLTQMNPEQPPEGPPNAQAQGPGPGQEASPQVGPAGAPGGAPVL